MGHVSPIEDVCAVSDARQIVGNAAIGPCARDRCTRARTVTVLMNDYDLAGTSLKDSERRREKMPR